MFESGRLHDPANRDSQGGADPDKRVGNFYQDGVRNQPEKYVGPKEVPVRFNTECCFGIFEINHDRISVSVVYINGPNIC